MFNAEFRAPNGNISAFFILDLMQSDTLYFTEDQIVSDPPRYRVVGMQLDPDRIAKYPQIAQDISAFSAAVLAWMAYCEKNADIFVPSQELPPQGAALTDAHALTPITLMNLLCKNALKFSRQESIFLAAAEEQVKSAIPSLGKFLRRLICAALAYDGCRQQDVNIIFASCEAGDVRNVTLRRLIVSAAATLEDPFDAQRLKALSPALDDFSTENVQKQLAAFARRGVFEAFPGDSYRLNFDSREAALLFAENDAAELAAHQWPLLQKRMLERAAAQAARVQKAAEDCQSTLAYHEEENVRLQAQAEALTPLCHAARKKADRKSSSGYATFTVLLLIFCVLCASVWIWQFFFCASQLTLLSIPVRLIALGAASLLLIWVILRMILAAHARKKAQALEKELSDTQSRAQEHQSLASDARRETGVYAAYLVLTRAIAADMAKGDFRGLELAMHLVPSELCAIVRDNAPAVRAKIIIALSHCGTCTHSELAFLSAAGHERVRRALYDMIAAGQVLLWRENDVEKFCLCRGVSSNSDEAAQQA